jgi:hypothetical protein
VLQEPKPDVPAAFLRHGAKARLYVGRLRLCEAQKAGAEIESLLRLFLCEEGFLEAVDGAN